MKQSFECLFFIYLHKLLRSTVTYKFRKHCYIHASFHKLLRSKVTYNDYVIQLHRTKNAQK